MSSSIQAAEAAFTSGDLETAEILSKELLQDVTSAALACHLLGVIALRRRDPQRAVEWMERAIENGLSNTMVLSNCGEAYRQLGLLEMAFSRFEQALRLDNTNTLAHLNLGLVMRSRGQAREAEHFFRTALSLNSGMARAHFELAELYRQEGHWIESEREYEEALTLVLPATEGKAGGDGRYRQWSVRLASLHREQGRPLRAVEILEVVLESDDQAADAHYEMARAKFELCWEESAKMHYLRASHLQPYLGLHERARIVSAQLASIADWREPGDGRYHFLARSQFLTLPPLKTLPTSASSAFMTGVAMTPELGCASIERAEVLPRDFTVMSRGRLFVVGVVNWAHHYAQRGYFSRHHADDNRVLMDLPSKINEYDGPCVLLGAASDHYAWMYENLARLWVTEQLPHLADLPLVVSAGILDEHLAMLHKFGVGGERLLRVSDDSTLMAAQLHVPALMTVGDWISPLALQFLRRRLGGVSASGRRRIFLSRAGLADRRLANEADLLGLLHQYGFEVFKIAGKTPLDLIALLRDAEAVIGMDDDAMANLVVGPQGARVGAIATAGAYRPRLHFICGQLAQDLTYLVGETVFESNPAHALCDVLLPEHVLRDFLRQVDKSRD